jgi:prepilin-type N-terminal cleavage/methylation domain-containing protein
VVGNLERLGAQPQAFLYFHTTNGGNVKTLKTRQRGFTLVEIMIVVAIIGLLATMSIASLSRARANAQKQTCVKNLSTIESGKQLWGLELGKTEGDEPTEAELVGPDKFVKETPFCPAGGTYTFHPIGAVATCSRSSEGHTL